MEIPPRSVPPPYRWCSIFVFRHLLLLLLLLRSLFCHDNEKKLLTTNTTKTFVAKAQEVALDAATGDYYAFDSETDRWAAEGNVGIQKAGADRGGVAAAIWADTSAALDGHHCGAKKVCACSWSRPWHIVYISTATSLDLTIYCANLQVACTFCFVFCF